MYVVANDRFGHILGHFARASRQWPANDYPNNDRRDCPMSSADGFVASRRWPRRTPRANGEPIVGRSGGTRGHNYGGT